MKDQVHEIEDLAELADDLVEAVAGGAGQMMDPDG